MSRRTAAHPEIVMEDGEARGRRDGGELVRDDGDRRRKERARFRRLRVSRHA